LATPIDHSELEVWHYQLISRDHTKRFRSRKSRSYRSWTSGKPAFCAGIASA